MRHCEVNPIELIWSQVKRFVASQNTTFRLKDVKILAQDAIQSITQEAWKKATDHVISIEDRLCAAEGIIESIPPVIVSFSSDEYSDSSDLSDDSVSIPPVVVSSSSDENSDSSNLSDGSE